VAFEHGHLPLVDPPPREQPGASSILPKCSTWFDVERKALARNDC
jgi:hypothetical protein